MLVNFVIYGHSWCLKILKITLAFLNTTREHKITKCTRIHANSFSYFRSRSFSVLTQEDKIVASEPGKMREGDLPGMETAVRLMLRKPVEQTGSKGLTPTFDSL